MRGRASRPQLKRDPLGGRDSMGFPTSFSITTIVRPPGSTSGLGPVLDYIDQTFQHYHADITHRGENFFEFKIPVGTRLVRELTSRLAGRSWTPLSFVASGTVSVTPLQDRVMVSADVQVSQYLLTRIALFGLITGLLSVVGGVIPALVVGVIAGLGMGAVSYGLAQWEFGSWLRRLDRLLRDAPPARGRLTSA